ncbi:MAG: DUF6159 family protein [Burkholderiales bacterium]
MFERFARSWTLVKASGSVLMADKELLIFPAVSAVALVMVTAGFALPFFGLKGLDALSAGEDAPLSAGLLLLGFLYYLCQYFVMFFFNTALVGAAMMRLSGGAPTLGDGLQIAASRTWPILGYAAIAATVGVILRVIQGRVGFIGQLIVGLLGIGWTLATFMVVPVLAARDVGPIDAIKESAELLKRTWGENVIGQAGLGIAFGFIYFAVIACGALLVAFAVATKSVALIVLALVVAIGAALAVALVHTALSGIYSAALYRYANDDAGTAGFDQQALKSAFAPAP